MTGTLHREGSREWYNARLKRVCEVTESVLRQYADDIKASIEEGDRNKLLATYQALRHWGRNVTPIIENRIIEITSGLENIEDQP